MIIKSHDDARQQLAAIALWLRENQPAEKQQLDAVITAYKTMEGRAASSAISPITTLLTGGTGRVPRRMGRY